MKMMKNITKILAVLGLLILTSCDFFLQKPDTTGTVDRDAVFGSKKNAQAALKTPMHRYRTTGRCIIYCHTAF